MSEQPPSQDLNFKFEVILDKEKETDIQRIKRWIAKQAPPWNTILEYLFSFIEKWYWDTKVQVTMDDVDRQAKEIVEQWNEEEKETKAPIITSKPSEVEGLDEIRIRAPWVRDSGESDWLAERPESWYQGPLELSQTIEERTKRRPRNSQQE
jgi:gas vesicle protein